MLVLQIAFIICSVPLGIWLGFKVAGICMNWLKYWLKGLNPPKRD